MRKSTLLKASSSHLVPMFEKESSAATFSSPEKSRSDKGSE